ncbi:GOLD-like protein [Cynara cardunculus var. scolymus]|uniref:GOLD-like protein n=1 Tax=Cynara cardunculus var. scolymus TaxID=59895 RepID=A0A103Y3D8_CYNCS|nr:GOLD-like protein [Cynara cardunculus var. scolymus]
MAEKARVLLPLLLFMLVLVRKGESVWLNIPRSGNKCVTEEIHNNVVVVGDYVVISDDHLHPTPTISAKVTSPYGNVLHHKENITHGQFAFTSSESGQYLTCFWPDRPGQGGALSVNIDWKIGVAAKDWETVARKEKIEVRNNFQQEAEMRGVSESTNFRVAWFSILSLGVCILVSCAQVWYLTRFFQKKKLI